MVIVFIGIVYCTIEIVIPILILFAQSISPGTSLSGVSVTAPPRILVDTTDATNNILSIMATCDATHGPSDGSWIGRDRIGWLRHRERCVELPRLC